MDSNVNGEPWWGVNFSTMFMSSAKRCFVDTLATTRNSLTLENGIKTALSLFSIISKHSNVLMPEQLHHRWVPSIVSTELCAIS